VKRDPVVLIVVAMIVTVMLVFGFRMARRPSGGNSAATGMKGQVAPDFALESLDGKTIHLSDFRGKAVALNFWATWCEPCKIETPWLVELQNQYGPNGFQVVGVSADEGDSKDDVAKFTKSMGVNYPILLGKENVINDYGGVQFLPETIYINRDGKVVDKVFGLKGKGEIEDYIKKSLSEGTVAKAQQ
jgi:thiol-disulfide isomerase/thioredoxin